ncbi:MAG: GntR family transcriptional regulator [Rhizobiaceae bacterium]|nr:GntR family transcriptional regulator [Rhizobiaceae bacterium]
MQIGLTKDAGASQKSRTARTCNLLREAIVNAQLRPGQKLRIDELGKTFDASIGAVREALSRLTAEGLVIAQPQKGFVVAPISRRDLIDLTEVRIDIENRCLAASIRSGDLDWEVELLSLHHRLKALGSKYLDKNAEEANQWHIVHERFHDQLTAACGNSWWLKLRRQLYTQSERYRRLSGPLDSKGRDITVEHGAIADAALARDAKTAKAAMTDHLRRTCDIILQSDIPFSDPDEITRSGDTRSKAG